MDLQRHLKCEPVIARPPSRLYEFQKTVRRHKVGFGATAGVVLTLILGVGALAYGLHRATAERDLARSISYDADMRLCWQNWTWSDYAGCRRLLAANVPRAGERDLRSFEWWYLSRLSQRDDLFALGPVPSVITGLAFLPGDRLLAAATQNRAALPNDLSPQGGGLFVWDWKSHRLLGRIETPPPCDLAVSPDGRLIATANWDIDTVIRILDGNTYVTVTNLCFTNLVTNLEFSPDGKILAIRGEHCVYLCNPTSNVPLETLPAYENDLEKPAFSRNGRLLCYMLPDRHLGLWDLREHRLVDELPNAAQSRMFGNTGQRAEDSFTKRHSFSPDGKLLASGDNYGRVMIHPLPAGTLRPIWEHFAEYALVAFSPDGKTLASASCDCALKLWDPLSGWELATYQGHSTAIRSVVYAPGGDLVFTAGGDGFIRAWDAHPRSLPRDTFGPQRRQYATTTPPTTTNLKTADQSAGVWSPNGRLLVRPGDLRPPTPARHDTIKEFPAGLERALSVGAKYLVCRGTNGLCHITDLEAETEVANFDPLAGETIGAISPDGRWVVTSFADGRVNLREPRAGTARIVPSAHTNRVTVAAFSPTGDTFATASRDGWLKVWAARDSRLVAKAQWLGSLHLVGPSALAFASDGSMVACGDDADARVLMLPVASGKPSYFIEMPFEGWNTRGLAFSPDGRVLAACAYSARAGLYDVHSGRLLGLVGDGSVSEFIGAEFTPDGRRLALAALGDITLWDMQTKLNVLTFAPTGDTTVDQMRFNSTGDRLVVTLFDTCKIFTAPRLP